MPRIIKDKHISLSRIKQSKIRNNHIAKHKTKAHLPYIQRNRAIIIIRGKHNTSPLSIILYYKRKIMHSIIRLIYLVFLQRIMNVNSLNLSIVGYSKLMQTLYYTILKN